MLRQAAGSFLLAPFRWPARWVAAASRPPSARGMGQPRREYSRCAGYFFAPTGLRVQQPGSNATPSIENRDGAMIRRRRFTINWSACHFPQATKFCGAMIISTIFLSSSVTMTARLYPVMAARFSCIFAGKILPLPRGASPSRAAP